MHDAYGGLQAVQVGGHIPNGASVARMPMPPDALSVTLQRPRPGRQIRETQHARRREQPGHVRRAAVHVRRAGCVVTWQDFDRRLVYNIQREGYVC